MLIQTKTLKNALSKLIGIVPQKPSVPILENVLFKQGEKLKLIVTDLEIFGVAELTFTKSDKIDFCVNAKRLYDTVKMIEDEQIEFIIDGNLKLTIKTKRGQYKLVCESADDFPSIPSERLEKLECEGLLEKIKKVAYACSNDILRPSLSGVLLADDIVGTDGHCLSLCSFSEGQNKPDLSLLEGKDFLIPKNVLNVVLRSASENSEVFYNDKIIQFDFECEDFTYSITSKLIDETYPNYKAVIPKDYFKRVFVKRNELLNSVKRLSIFSSSTTHMIKIRFDKKLEISAIDNDLGAEAKEEIEVTFEGEATEVGMNATYLINTLQNMTAENITIEFNEPTNAVIFEEENHKCIVMPVRLN